MIVRRISTQIIADLGKKMVILSGPRQCGKTTLSKLLLSTTTGSYFNWDDPKSRLKIQKGDLDLGPKLWVFDELHKYRKWRNFLKGLYDLNHEDHQIFVTGSAKLDAFARGGDSLQGRYYSHRLHP
ncbi:MAG: AAA family ATPase, partial [Bdellovibrionia bacterium]